MDKPERDRLYAELSAICLAYHPDKGPHQVEEVAQSFDYYQIDKTKQIEQQRTGVLEYSAAQNLNLSPQAINAYFNDKQQYAGERVKEAYASTCKANNLPVQERVEFRTYGNEDYAEIAVKGRLANVPPPPNGTEQGDGRTPPVGGAKEPEKLTPTNIPPPAMRQQFGFDPKSEGTPKNAPVWENHISLEQYRAQQQEQQEPQARQNLENAQDSTKRRGLDLGM